MADFVHKTIIKSINLIEENFGSKCIYMSFSQYVSLVQHAIVNYLAQRRWKKKKLKPLIFTALCITPFQWFNFRITPKNFKRTAEIENIADIKEMYADEHWIDYHHFLIRHTCSNFQFHNNKIECSAKKDTNHCHKGVLHRMFLSKNKGYCHNEIEDQTRFDFFRYLFTIDFIPIEKVHFPNNLIVGKQLSNFSIGELNDNFLFSQSDLKDFSIPYMIPADKKAYLIADDNLKQTILDINNNFQFFPLKDFFTKLYQNPSSVNSNYKLAADDYGVIARNRLPEDFIIFGYTESGNRIWEFAIASDVAIEKEFSKVTLQFGDNNATFINLYKLVNKILNEHPTH